MNNTTHYTIMKTIFAFTIIITFISSCGSNSPSSQNSNNEVQDIRVQIAQPEKNNVKVEQFPLPNCGGTDKLAQSLGTYASVSKSATVSNRANVTGGGEVGIPEATRLKLEIQVELTYQKTYESANSRVDSIEMSAAPGTHVVYTIIWEEQTFNSIVQYSTGDQVYEAPYTYNLSIPKIDTSYQVVCPGNNPIDNAPQNTAPPLPPTSSSTNDSNNRITNTPPPVTPPSNVDKSGSVTNTPTTGVIAVDCTAQPHTALNQGDHFFPGSLHIVELWRQNGQTPWGDRLVTAVVVGDVAILSAGGSVWTYPAGCEDAVRRQVVEGAGRTDALVVTQSELQSAGLIR
jgi:hypothetical protein